MMEKIFNIYREKVVPNLGVTLLLLSQMCNAIMVISCKLLVTDRSLEHPINPFQILFARMSITYTASLLYMWIRKVENYPWGPPHLRPFLVARACLGFFGVFGLYYSLQYLSVSDAVVITFLAPAVAPILARIILKESYTVVEAIGGIVSFFGVILIARPHFLFPNSGVADSPAESGNPRDRFIATCVALLGVVGASSVTILLRYIGFGAHPLISVSYFSLAVTIISCIAIVVVPSYTFQVPQSSKQWFLFTLMGVSGFVMQFLMTAGIQRVKTSKAALTQYTQVIYALVFDLLIWHHFPGFLSFMGSVIIIGSASAVLMAKQNDNSRSTDLESLTDKFGSDVSLDSIPSRTEL